MEAYDTVTENLAILEHEGACAMIHSDSENGIQRLNQEVAKARIAGVKAGFDIPEEVAWKWLAINPARAMGIDKQTGSLKPGKMADVVLWNGNPFSIYTRPAMVWGRRRAALRRQGSEAPPGFRFRARPAGRRGCEVMRRLLLAAAAAAAFLAAPPAAAQDVAIVNAKLVIGDGSAPVEGGTVVIRGGRVVAAGAGVAVPAGVPTIDAQGKWVSPGIFAGFTRLGIVEVDAVDGTNDFRRQRIAVPCRARRDARGQSADHRDRAQPAPRA